VSEDNSIFDHQNTIYTLHILSHMQGIAEQQARPVGFRRGQDVERAAESRKHNRHGKLAYPGGHSCARIDLTMDSACEILNQMVKYSETRLNATFAALADTTRRRILARLALGDTSVSDLAAPFDISLPGVTSTCAYWNEQSSSPGARKEEFIAAAWWLSR